MTVMRIGTRASALARAQTQYVADALRSGLGVDVELVDITTAGDRSSALLEQIGGQGVFVGAVREAVTAGEVDIAVHSLKDLPTMPDTRVVLAAIPPREDPRDAVVARDGLTLDSLGAGARVGTGSPRRAAQIRALGLDLDVVPVRGNVGTRIGKVSTGELDAVVLARAGLVRVGSEDQITENLDPSRVLPAPGQGALAVEVSADAEQLAAEVAGILDDVDTRYSVTAERAVLHTLQAGCSAPVGALAAVQPTGDSSGPVLNLSGVVAAVDGGRLVRLTESGPATDANELGVRLAQTMLDEGAAELMQAEPITKGVS